MEAKAEEAKAIRSENEVMVLCSKVSLAVVVLFIVTATMITFAVAAHLLCANI